MAKRYIDTTLYDQKWFQSLHPVYKCFWHYICSKCDHAGIWEVNINLAQFSIDPEGIMGVKLEYDELLELFDLRIIDLGRDKWYITKYVIYHHGELLHPKNNFHMSVVKILEKHNLVDEYVDGNYHVRMIPYKDEKTAKKKTSDTNKNNIQRFKPPTIKECVDYFTEKGYTDAKYEANKFWNFYESKGWMVGKNKMKKWHSAAANWMSKKTSNNERTHIQEGHLEEKRGW